MKLFKFKSKNVVKFYVHISPVFSCWVTYMYIAMHACMYMKDAQLYKLGLKQILDYSPNIHTRKYSNIIVFEYLFQNS